MKSIDPSVHDAVLKAKLLKDFLFFVRYFFKQQYGIKFVVNHHHERLAEKIYDVVTGKTTRLIINIPPRYSKTELFVKGFIAWSIANNPQAKFIHLSYSDELALDNSSSIRELIKHEEFQRIFPVQLKKDSDSKKKWYTSQGGGVYATAAGGGVTGFGAGMLSRTYQGTGSPADGFGGAIIIDDPLKPDDAFSKAQRDRVNRRFNNTIKSRLNSKDTPIIVIMQRLHVEDMSGFLLNGGSGDEWEHLCMPALVDDVALWEEKHSVEELKKMEQADPYTFAGQYQQQPFIVGGNLFKPEWFQYYSALPKLKRIIITADTAQKTKETNDYSVFECWGLGIDGNAYLIDLIRGKWEAPELLIQARAFYNKHKTKDYGKAKLSVMYVEDKVSGTTLIQTMKRESGFIVEGIQRSTDKVTRAMDVIPSISSGRVYLPQSAPWLSDFLAEAEQFPNGINDDQIDPMMDAIDKLLLKGGVDWSAIM